MMSKLRASRERDERSFTLIELLVVILIIAILAAIAIPVFLRQREKGWVAQNESALKNAAIAAESFATANQGVYVDAAGADMAEADLLAEGYNATDTVTLDVQVLADGTEYCIQGTHDSLTDTYGISSLTGKPQVGTCLAGVFKP